MAEAEKGAEASKAADPKLEVAAKAHTLAKDAALVSRAEAARKARSSTDPGSYVPDHSVLKSRFVPVACYVNGREIFGEVELTDGEYDHIVWQLEARKAHDERLTKAERYQEIDLGKLRG